MTPIGPQWAVLVITKKTFVLFDYKPVDTRKEARDYVAEFKKRHQHTLHLHRVYIGRTNGF